MATTMGGSPGPMRGSPGIRTAMRQAGEDWYFYSLVMVTANVVWALAIVMAWISFLALGPAVGCVALVAVALPTGVLFRVAGMVVRGEPVGLRDAVDWRGGAVASIVLGTVLVASATIVTVDLLVGVAAGGVIGTTLATAAAWAAVAVIALGSCAWPVVTDPRRRGSSRAALRLAVTVCLVAPRRVAVVLAVSVVIWSASAVLFVALATIAMGYLALLLCRVVLPIADRAAPATTTQGADRQPGAM